MRATRLPERTLSKIAGEVERRKDRLVNLLRDLVQVPSVTGQEGDAQSLVRDELRGMGLDVVTLHPDVDKLRESLRKHVETLRGIRDRREPKPGELARVYLEEEFEY